MVVIADAMYGQQEPGRRAAGAVLTLVIHGVIAVGLLWGLSFDDPPPGRTDSPVLTVAIEPPPQPPPPQRREQQSAKKPPGDEGVMGEATPVEAPAAPVQIVPTAAAPAAGEGRGIDAGAGDVGAGAGAGAGAGIGGGGEGGGAASPARRIAGALRDSDYPREAEASGLAGTVAIGFRVRTDGQVDRCTVVRSSGHDMLDDLTCRLFTARYRFRPALTASGEPVESTLQTSFTWGTRRR